MVTPTRPGPPRLVYRPGHHRVDPGCPWGVRRPHWPGVGGGVARFGLRHPGRRRRAGSGQCREVTLAAALHEALKDGAAVIPDHGRHRVEPRRPHPRDHRAAGGRLVPASRRRCAPPESLRGFPRRCCRGSQLRWEQPSSSTRPDPRCSDRCTAVLAEVPAARGAVVGRRSRGSWRYDPKLAGAPDGRRSRRAPAQHCRWPGLDGGPTSQPRLAVAVGCDQPTEQRRAAPPSGRWFGCCATRPGPVARWPSRYSSAAISPGR